MWACCLRTRHELDESWLHVIFLVWCLNWPNKQTMAPIMVIVVISWDALACWLRRCEFSSLVRKLLALRNTTTRNNNQNHNNRIYNQCLEAAQVRLGLEIVHLSWWRRRERNCRLERRNNNKLCITQIAFHSPPAARATTIKVILIIMIIVHHNHPFPNIACIHVICALMIPSLSCGARKSKWLAKVPLEWRANDGDHNSSIICVVLVVC